MRVPACACRSGAAGWVGVRDRACLVRAEAVWVVVQSRDLLVGRAIGIVLVLVDLVCVLVQLLDAGNGAALVSGLLSGRLLPALVTQV